MQAFGNINSRRLQSSQYGASTLPAAPKNARSSADASLWLALRAGVLRRAISPSGTALLRRAEVSASGAFTANLTQPQTCRPLCAGRCGRFAAARVARPVLGLSARFVSNLGLRGGHSDFTPKKISCAVPAWQVQWLQNASACKTAPVLANPALNLTLCGGPILVSISFQPKIGPPQSAG